MLSNGVDGLALCRGTIEGDDLPSWGHLCYGRGFLRKVLWLNGREILSVDATLNESTSLW